MAVHKNPKSIRVNVLRRSIEEGLMTQEKAVAESNLFEKMEEFILKLGYSNADAQAIIVELMTKGKVRVDFRNYTERLELISLADTTNTAEAIQIFNDSLKEINSNQGMADGDPKMTRIFRVQRLKGL